MAIRKYFHISMYCVVFFMSNITFWANFFQRTGFLKFKWELLKYICIQRILVSMLDYQFLFVIHWLSFHHSFTVHYLNNLFLDSSKDLHAISLFKVLSRGWNKIVFFSRKFFPPCMKGILFALASEPRHRII